MIHIIQVHLAEKMTLDTQGRRFTETVENAVLTWRGRNGDVSIPLKDSTEEWQEAALKELLYYFYKLEPEARSYL